MITKIPQSYILIHEACNFLIGTSCEKISMDYLLTDNEIKLQSLLSEESKLQAAEKKAGEALSAKLIDIEQKIDSLDKYSNSLRKKLAVHCQVRNHFYFLINRYGSMDKIQSRLLAADGGLHSFSALSFYGSEVEYEIACKNSEGNVITTNIDNSEPILHVGHIILKKKDLISLQPLILDELQEEKVTFEMTEEDWENIEFATVTPDRKLCDYENLPNFSEENKEIIKMAREEYSKLHESKKGHGEVSVLAGIIKSEMHQKETPITKKENSVAAFLKKHREYWQ